MSREKLTRLEESIYNYICDYLTENGYPPTEKEISEGCYISNAVAHRYIDKLQQKGYIYRQPKKARTLKVV